ncbi:MAG: YidC/Oxa1 family membrane protein insertase [Acidimicrobiales bacterium]|nr:YidC/Oxa1 family membrane protein insertase [Acidimicrobiales bacterium]
MDIFDPILEVAAQILDFFYGIVPNYAIAIIMMTMLVMVITTPLTLKGTRGMIKMQLMQPELKKIQEKHKGGDRQEMNAEMMAFYQENELNPLGGCLPLLVQAPVFILLFNVIRGLTRTTAEACAANPNPESLSSGTECFDPDHVEAGSNLYDALYGSTEMTSFGLDLAESTTEAVGDSIAHGLPYLVLILIMIGAQYLQQKQVSARNKDGDVAMPQQKILLRVMPAVFGVISINFPAALVVYWLTSSVYRIGLQYYITRALYGHEESEGAKAQRAAKEAREIGKNKTGGGGAAPATGGKDTGSDGPGGSSGNGAGTGGGGPSTNGGAGNKPQPGSKKKKKPRRR